MSATSKRMAAAALAVTLVFSLSACSNWSKRDRNTAIGAGAIGGSVLTHGSGLGTIGSDAGGGIIRWIDVRCPFRLPPYIAISRGVAVM